MIEFQEPQFEEQFKKLEPKLLDMIAVMDFLAEKICKEPKLVVTSVIRPDPPYNVHLVGHAVDFSLLALQKGKLSGQKIRDMMNMIYKYDFQRPKMECIPTLFHGTAPHIHLQYHPNTSAMDPEYVKHIQTILAFDERAYNGGKNG